MRLVRARQGARTHVFRAGRNGGTTMCNLSAKAMEFVIPSGHHGVCVERDETQMHLPVSDDITSRGQMPTCIDCLAEVMSILLGWQAHLDELGS